MQKLSKRLLGSVHVSTPPSTPPCSPFPFMQRHQSSLLPTMDKLTDAINLEKKIADRCKKSLDRNEPYDLKSMKQQLNYSLSRITALKTSMGLIQNFDNTSSSSSQQTSSPSSNINHQIMNTQLLCQGAQKMKQSLIKTESPNEKVLRETEQTILVLNEKLELLIQCSKLKESISTPISVRRTRDGSRKNRSSLPAQVSGLLKIRVTGVVDTPADVKPRVGKYASEYLAQSVKKKKSMFRHYGFRRPHRETASNDFIVVIHVSGNEVATMVWNEKKTMVGGDEEPIQLFKSRQLDFEVYHTDSRSLCAIGSMQLESLLNEHDAKDHSSTIAHRVVDLMPRGSLHFQTTYSLPDQSFGKIVGENYCDGASTLPMNVRKSGKVVARGTQRSFNPRATIASNQFVPPSPSVKSRPRKVDSLESYRLLSDIGVGAFGTVKLAQRVDDDMYCAMKIIERDPRTRKFDTPELNILNLISHPFICSLIASFIENDSLHLVLEFCEAGDLHTHLSRTAHGFTKPQVKYFAESIVLAIEYLHSKLYVHRDLKTENMMLTRQGILKIIDFGLCKKLSSRSEKMHEIVGTTTHLSAEIHRREPYGIEMDWWAVGVSLYQLRTRQQPFYWTREVEMQRNSRITDWFTFNDLLISLMSNHPSARLGFHSTEDVKKHPFFMESDFDAVLNAKVSPPYVPLMKHELDLDWFDYEKPTGEQFDTSSSSFTTTSINSINRINNDLTM